MLPYTSYTYKLHTNYNYQPSFQLYFCKYQKLNILIVQELCESRGGRPELSVLTSLLASVDVKIY